MPKINVAFCEEPGDNKKLKAKKRLASGSFTTIKNKLKKYPGSKWVIAQYNFKPNVENIIQVIVNLGKMEPEFTKTFQVNDTGSRVREVE